VAANPNALMEALAKLRNDEHPSVQENAALSPAERLELTAKALDAALADAKEMWYDRLSRAEDPNTSPEELAILANDPNWQVRAAVAANPNTSMEALAKLRNDTDMKGHYYYSASAFVAADLKVPFPSKDDETLHLVPLDPDAQKNVALPADDEHPSVQKSAALSTEALAKLVTGRAETYKIGDVGPAGGVLFTVGEKWYEAAPRDIGKFNWEEALSAARKYSHGGHSDWCLPSKDELNAMYENRDLIGGFSTASYWSSSEHHAFDNPHEYEVDAWIQNFRSGNQLSLDKYDSGYVRPVRALLGT